MNLQIAKNRRAATAARKKETPQGCTEPAAAEPERWVNDSWIAECEVASVYSSGRPVFRYAEQPTAAVMLTQSELQLLAQRHLNTVLITLEYFEWKSHKCDRVFSLRKSLHESRKSLHDSRFWQLFEQLTPEGQERFKEQIKIRNQYIESVAAELRRCSEQEAAFWDVVKEGFVSEAAIWEHVIPPCIRSGGCMPAPADGGPGPEEWDIFNDYDEDENPLPGSNEVASAEA